MNRDMEFHAFRKAAWLLVLALLLSACVTPPTGTSRLYKPTTDEKVTNKVFGQVTSGTTLRHVANDEDASDTFSIYLSDGYFRYLKDFAGVNEVVIIAELTEVRDGVETDTVTRVLGPYYGIADKTQTPFLNKLIYGPKRLESDHLSMKLTVLEYDQGENKNRSDFLDFIATSSQALSLANPVTLAEQKVVKEIVKSLIGLNKDDVVMEIDIDFTADSGDLARHTSKNGRYIPLDPGDYLFISRENCALLTCRDYLTKNTPWNLFAVLSDVLLFIPTELYRAWSDTPDYRSIKPVEPRDLAYKDDLLLKDGDLYEDKTWLRLAIVKGGDSAHWDRRKVLNALEKSILDASRYNGSRLIESTDLAAIDSAAKTLRELHEASGQALSFSGKLDDDRLCFYHKNKPEQVSAMLYRYEEKQAKPLPISPVNIVSPNNSCFKAGEGGTLPTEPGHYDVFVQYVMDGKARQQKISYSIPPTTP